MAELSMDGSVTGDFLRVALDVESGKLKHCNVLAEAMRGALLIDLARHGNLSRSNEVNRIDTAPTGMALADELLHDMSTHPKRRLDVWMQRGTPHLHEFIAELLADGFWTVKRHRLLIDHARYSDKDAVLYEHLHGTLVGIIHGKAPADERQAALAALANVTGLGEPGPYLNHLPAHILAATHDLGWIVTEVTTFLYEAQGNAIAAGTASAYTTGIQIGSV
jgi:hypothetical protein